MQDNKTRTVTITLTQLCNLKCTYCYEHYKSPRKMDWETAQSILDVELGKDDGNMPIEFDLFGGEPFLAFDLIKKITEYVCKHKGDRLCTVFATTNGTLVHGEVQSWLRDHKNCFVCGLSLDGTREMHNQNRSGSYDSIDLAFFQEMYPDQDVKMTISQDTLPYLAEGVIDMHRKGFPVSCNLAYEIDWSAADNSKILERELNKLIDFYINNPNIEPCSMLEMGISNVVYDCVDTVRYCGTGKYMCSYDVDGTVYPCQFFMPLSLGEEKAKKAKDIAFPGDIIPRSCLDSKCQDCIIRSVCMNCFGANYSSTGSIYRRDDNLCYLTKIIIRARSLFRAKQWELGELKGTQEEIQMTLRSIIKIQEELIV